MNILQITQSEIAGKFNVDILDEITKPDYNIGKNTDTHWMLKTDSHLNSTDYDAQMVNSLLFQARISDHNSLMIIKEKPTD